MIKDLISGLITKLQKQERITLSVAKPCSSEYIRITAVSLFFFDFRLPRPKRRRHKVKKKQRIAYVSSQGTQQHAATAWPL